MSNKQIHTPTDTASDDASDRGIIELSPEALKYEQSVKAALLSELAAKKDAGSDGAPRARRGKKDVLQASDYEEPVVKEVHLKTAEPVPEPVADRDDVDPIQGDVRSGGLAGLRERAALLNGHLTVETHPGRGVRLTAEVPLSGSLRRGVE